MKHSVHILVAVLLFSTINSQLSTVFAQGTAFTYQGRLNNNGAPANGSYDFSFALSNSGTGGLQLAGPVTNTAVFVTNGLFTTTMDFGNVFNGSSNWLQIDVSAHGANSFQPLTPRQQLTPTPYAIYAANAATAATATSANAATTATSATTAGTAANFSGALAGDVTGTQSATVVAKVAGVTAANVASGVNAANAAASVNTVNTIVKRDGSGNFSAGTITASLAGNAATATTATSANAVAAANITGKLGLGQLPTNVLTTASGALGLTIQNNADGAPNVIEGSSVNFVSPGVEGATIGGGGEVNNYTNSVTGNFGTVSGGQQNTATNIFATVGGGSGNTAGGDSSTVSGGSENTASGNTSTVSGGYNNSATTDEATVGGGYSNLASDIAATVSGGQQNKATNSFAMVGGGSGNTAGGVDSTVGGGQANTTSDEFATVGGGIQNIASGDSSTVSGGSENTASGIGSFVGGGGYDGSTSAGNTASGNASVVGGGFGNQAANSYATVDGGYYNTASGFGATVAGGENNIASGIVSFAAGFQARAVNQGAFVWGDSQTAAFTSTANDQFLIRAQGGVGINKNNPATALDVNGTVKATTFSGSGSGLTSLNAANLAGAVPSASLTSVPAASLTGTINNARLSGVALTSGGNAFTGNQTIMSGNVGIGTTTPDKLLDVAGAAAGVTNGSGSVESSLFLKVKNTQIGGTEKSPNVAGIAFGRDGQTLQAIVGGTYGNDFIDFYTGAQLTNARVRIDSAGNVGIGTTAPAYTLDVNGSIHASGNVYAGSVELTSDRNAKENFGSMNPATVLAKVASLPITEWNYKTDSHGVQHLGPMAQDFHAAFDLNGTDDKHISVIDEGGVALAAIQGLNEKLQDELNRQDAENTKLKQQNDSLAARLNELEAMVNVLNQKLNGGVR